jgi:hypothetical protein
MRHVKLICLLVAMIGIAACDDDEGDGDDYEAVLTGGAERPTPVTTTATGNFDLQDDGASMSYTLTVNNITGPIIGAHIHAVPVSGVAAADTTGGIVVNLNPSATVTSGVLAQGTITQASILGLNNAAPISLDSLRDLLNSGRTYVNVHTQASPGGHIRGTVTRD